MKYGLRVLALALLVSCLNCGWMVKPAEVELVGLAFPGESVLDLSVKVRNPNSFSAKVSDVEYTVFIGSEAVGRGRANEVLSLRGRDSLVTCLPLSYDMAALFRVLPQLAQDTIVCRVDGTYQLEVLLLKPRMKFSVERRIAVKEKLLAVLGAVMK
ncbi:MAG: LEA type 2 family protein [candidate division WOR-3 bacterium]